MVYSCLYIKYDVNVSCGSTLIVDISELFGVIKNSCYFFHQKFEIVTSVWLEWLFLLMFVVSSLACTVVEAVVNLINCEYNF